MPCNCINREKFGIMDHQSHVRRRKRRRPVSVSEAWLVPLMERFYEPNKPAIVVAGVVLLPFCIRLVLPSPQISKFVLMPDHSWLTPPMLFLLLNLVIGTIAITSTKKTSKTKNASRKYGERFEEEEEMLLPIRTPLVEPANPPKRRLKSSREIPYSPVIVEPPKPPSSLDVGMNRSEGSASVKVFEVPAMESLTTYLEDDIDDEISPDDPSAEEVNAKADDFIQKFKQELILQRLRSFRERKRAGR